MFGKIRIEVAENERDGPMRPSRCLGRNNFGTRVQKLQNSARI